MIDGKRYVDDLGQVYAVRKNDDDGYWYLGAYVPQGSGSWSPFGKRITDKVINRMVEYMKMIWNKE